MWKNFKKRIPDGQFNKFLIYLYTSTDIIQCEEAHTSFYLLKHKRSMHASMLGISTMHVSSGQYCQLCILYVTLTEYNRSENELNFNGIQFPMSLKQIPIFEKQNNISVNVYTLKKSGGKFKIVPLHITSCKKETHINLLLLQNCYIDDEESKQEENIENNLSILPYVSIKDLSRLVSTQLSKRDGQKYFWDR